MMVGLMLPDLYGQNRTIVSKFLILPTYLLVSFPTPGEEDLGVLSTQQVALLQEEAWLIKTQAVELRMTTLNHQRSHAQRIINLLLNEPTNEDADPDHMTDYGDQRSDFDFLQEKKRKILILLDAVDFSEKATPTFELQFFDQSAMEEAIKSCETRVSVHV